MHRKHAQKKSWGPEDFSCAEKENCFNWWRRWRILERTLCTLGPSSNFNRSQNQIEGSRRPRYSTSKSRHVRRLRQPSSYRWIRRKFKIIRLRKTSRKPMISWKLTMAAGRLNSPSCLMPTMPSIGVTPTACVEHLRSPLATYDERK